MNESADESLLECFSSPKSDQQRVIGHQGGGSITKNNLATIQNTDYFVSWSSVSLDLQQF